MQRTLQAYADRWLGWARMDGEPHDGVGCVVKEYFPYESDLDWSALTGAEEMADVLEQLGRATAKVHCVFDVDAGHAPLVESQTEDAIADVVPFALDYGATVRSDHAVFVDAFRNGRVPGVGPSAS